MLSGMELTKHGLPTLPSFMFFVQWHKN